MMHRKLISNLCIVVHRSRFCTHSCLYSSIKQLNIAFFGNDSFSLSSLQPLHNKLVSGSDLIRSITVVSVSHSLITKFARSHNLPLLTWPIEQLDQKYDLGVVVSFGHLIPGSMIAKCELGILNVHGSLLPRWRGASPIHQAILAGDEVTGVTVMLIEPLKFDVGAIVAQKEYRMPERPTSTAVHSELARIGGELLLETIEQLPQSLSKAYPQPSDGVTRAPKPKKEDGHIVFEAMSSVDIDRTCRALQGLVDLYCDWVDGRKIKLSNIVFDPSNLSHLDDVIGHACEPGSIVYNKRRRILCFKCNDGQWVGFEKVTMQGCRNMTALEFFNGFMSRLLKSPCPGCKLKKIVKTS